LLSITIWQTNVEEFSNRDVWQLNLELLARNYHEHERVPKKGKKDFQNYKIETGYRAFKIIKPT